MGFDPVSYLMGTRNGGGGGGSYPWFGPGTEKVDTKQQLINLANDTSWASWTPSTTAGTILATPSSYDYEWSVDMSSYDYYVIVRAVTDIALKDTATLSKIPMMWGRTFINEVYGNPSNYQQWQSGDRGTTSYGTLSVYFSESYNSAGEKTILSSSNASPMFITSSSLSNSSSKIFYKRPDIKAQCSTNYFDTARAADIDAANTNMTIDIELYRTPITGSLMAVEIDKLRRAMLG